MTETESESAALRDAKLAELERELAKQLERNKLLKHANSLFASSGDNDELVIDQLRRELAEARKDAERYRWLRNKDNWGDDTENRWAILGELTHGEFDNWIDAAIDAALIDLIHDLGG